MDNNSVSTKLLKACVAMSKVTQALLLAKVNSSPINGLVLYCDEDTQEALGQMSIDIETEIIKGRPYVLLNGLRI